MWLRVLGGGGDRGSATPWVKQGLLCGVGEWQ